MTIQEKLDNLRPYVVGIRYVKGIKVVEAQFESKWSLLKDDNFKVVSDKNDKTYLYIMPQAEGVSIDDVLDYVSKVIDYNIEQEKKHKLLKEKVEELKSVFKTYSYEQLKHMDFKVGEDEDNTDNDDLISDHSELTSESTVSPDVIDNEEEQKETEKEGTKEQVASKEETSSNKNSGKSEKKGNKKSDNKKSHQTTKVSEGELELPPNGSNEESSKKK